MALIDDIQIALENAGDTVQSIDLTVGSNDIPGTPAVPRYILSLRTAMINTAIFDGNLARALDHAIDACVATGEQFSLELLRFVDPFGAEMYAFPEINILPEEV